MTNSGEEVVVIRFCCTNQNDDDCVCGGNDLLLGQVGVIFLKWYGIHLSLTEKWDMVTHNIYTCIYEGVQSQPCESSTNKKHDVIDR